MNGQVDPVDLEKRVAAEQVRALAAMSLAYVAMVPIWAFSIAFVMSGPFPVLGVTPWSVSGWWCAACTGSALLAFLTDRLYTRARRSGTGAATGKWRRIFLCVRALLAIAWGSSFWFFWHPENEANHLFLVILVLAASVNNTVERSGLYLNFIGTVWTLMGLGFFRLLFASTPVAGLFLMIIPAWTAWLSWDMWKVCRQIRTSFRTQFENEALAEALIAARDEAEKNRLLAERASATKTAFLANMSHELRTPLNAILGFSEVISTEAFGPNARERYRDYAGDILASGRHLLSLINDLLDIAKIEAGKLEVTPLWLDAAEAVRECLHLMEDRASERKIRLTWSVSVNAANVFADERAFRQILFNLVSNAIKFTPDDGRVEVRVSRKGGEIVLIVEDTGCGIPQDKIACVFLPFEQIDNRYAALAGGTGLGLTLVRALAEMHGGKCGLDSEEGEGTTVWASFPIPDRDAAGDWAKAAAPKALVA
jgi:two-component system cell cycle sensor histidine kinase PleC